jgi:hypothetical protein
MGAVLALPLGASAALPGDGTPLDSATTGLDGTTLRAAGDGSIDFIGTDPASQNGAIVATVLSSQMNDDGTATAQIKVRNASSLWYKLYVETVGDVNVNFEPLVLEDDGGKFLYLPPEGASDFAYPTLEKTVTFNDPNGGSISFSADRSIASGFGALFLQQLEILSRAGTGIPALPSDEAGAMAEVVKGSTEGFDPFVDVATAIQNGEVWGTIQAVSELGRDPEALDLIQMAFLEIGTSLTEEQIENVSVLGTIASLSWYITDFIVQGLTFSGAIPARFGPSTLGTRRP